MAFHLSPLLAAVPILATDPPAWAGPVLVLARGRGQFHHPAHRQHGRPHHLAGGRVTTSPGPIMLSWQLWGAVIGGYITYAPRRRKGGKETMERKPLQTNARLKLRERSSGWGFFCRRHSRPAATRRFPFVPFLIAAAPASISPKTSFSEP